jgi:hypothetical protein
MPVSMTLQRGPLGPPTVVGTAVRVPTGELTQPFCAAHYREPFAAKDWPSAAPPLSTIFGPKLSYIELDPASKKGMVRAVERPST